MINLGGLYFSVGADTKGLDSARQSIQNFGRDVERAFSALKTGSVDSSFANGLLKQERAIISMLERVKSLQDQINRSGITGRSKDNLFSDLNAAYTDFVKRMSTPVPLNTAEFSRASSNMNSILKDTQREFTGLQRAAMEAQRGTIGFSGVLQGLGSASLLVQGHLGGMSTRFFAFTQIMRDFGVIAGLTIASLGGVAAALALLGGGAISAGKDMMSLTAAMTAVTGNAAVAGAQLNFVKDVSNQAGTEFQATAQSYEKFLAAARASGLSMDKIQASFRGMAVEAATLQLSTEDLQGVFKALEQMLSKGTVQSEELRGQLGDRFPAAFAIAAQAIGKTTAQLETMLKKRQVISAEFVPAFVNAAAKIYNIDLSKPVDTLNASLARLSNNWTYFSIGLNNATNATGVYKALVESTSAILAYFTQNMVTILGVVGAVAGAVAGLVTGLIALQIISWIGTAFAAASAYMTAFGVAEGLATGATIALETALTFLQNLPIIRIITLLGLAAIGATIGFDKLTQAANQNNAAMSNTSGIESYIDAQKRLGFQVRSTTNDFIKQMVVIAQNQSMKVKQDAKDLRDAKGGPSAFDRLTAFFSGAGGGGGVSADQAYATRMKNLVDTTRSDMADLRHSMEVMRGLADVSKLPEMPSTPVTPVPQKEKHGPRDSIDRINDFILKMKSAEAQLKQLSSGNEDYKLVDDLYRAQEALNQMDPKQLGKVDAALKAAGFSSGTLDERLGAVLTRTREAQDAARVFVQIWDDTKQGVLQLQNLNQQLDYLKKGGDTRQLYIIEAYGKAAEALKDIRPNTEAGQNALLGIQNRLTSLGIEVNHTGNLLDDTTDALARFNLQGEQTGKLVSLFAQFNSTMEQARDNLGRIQGLSAAYEGHANGLGQYFNVGIGDEADKAIARGQAVKNMIRDLRAAGDSQADINAKANEYLNILRQTDAAQEVYDRQKEKAQQSADALKDLAHAGLQTFRDLITGAKSFGDALLDLANHILDTLWQKFITQPLDRMIDSLTQVKGKKETNGLDAVVAGLSNIGAAANTGVPTAANDNGAAAAANAVTSLASAAGNAANTVGNSFVSSLNQGIANVIQQATSTATATAATTAKTAADTTATGAVGAVTFALNALTTAANNAAAALASVSAGGGSGTGGGGFGSILSGITSLFGGGGGGLSDVFYNGVGMETDPFAMAAGFATGGHMSAGTLYQINEPGISGEYFIPSVNGYMTPQSAVSRGGNTGGVMIDASTTIDARGATAENIADLRSAMAARDARLRSELPLLIDRRVQDSASRRRY